MAATTTDIMTSAINAGGWIKDQMILLFMYKPQSYED